MALRKFGWSGLGGWGNDRPKAPVGQMAKSDGIAKFWEAGHGEGGQVADRPKAPVRKMAMSDGIAEIWVVRSGGLGS